MHNKSYVFAQLTSFLNRNKFNRIVAKYHGDNYIKHFSCWNQLKVLMFDVKIAKNYLSELELQRLNLLVSGFLDFAEFQVLEMNPIR